MTESRHRPPKAPSQWKPWRVILLLVIAIGVFVFWSAFWADYGDRSQPVQSDAMATTATAAPQTTADPTLSEAQVRAAFMALAGADAGLEPIYGSPENVVGLAGQTCATITADPTSDGVWAAARNLEDGLFQFPDLQAWAFVDIAVTVYCPSQGALVASTIADVTG